MNTFSGYQVGVNLGGWISQYPRYDLAHFEGFIGDADIRQIASWGMDHVRLPVDYPVLEDDERPFEYKPSGLAYIDNCLTWCQAAGLNLILDLHRAPGYSFGSLAENSLFTSSQMQERFLRLWEKLAERYRGQAPSGLVFELLNEVVLPTSEPWNRLAHKAFERIRAADPLRWVMIGGNHYNSAWTLKEIELVDDPRVVYTFHFYEPMPFTHQRAGWMENMTLLNGVVDYPGMVPGLGPFLEQHPQFRDELGKYLTTPMDIAILRSNLQPALDFQNKTGLPLYCGEFGAIDHAPLQSRLNWHREFIGLLRENKIGRAVWSYKEMNFRLVDQNGKVASQELVKIVSQP